MLEGLASVSFHIRILALILFLRADMQCNNTECTTLLNSSQVPQCPVPECAVTVIDGNVRADLKNSSQPQSPVITIFPIFFLGHSYIISYPPTILNQSITEYTYDRDTIHFSQFNFHSVWSYCWCLMNYGTVPSTAQRGGISHHIAHIPCIIVISVAQFRRSQIAWAVHFNVAGAGVELGLLQCGWWWMDGGNMWNCLFALQKYKAVLFSLSLHRRRLCLSAS